MVFGRESEGAFFLLHLHANTKPTYIKPFHPHAGTIKHATAARLAVFICALDFPQSEVEGAVLIKDAGELSGEERVVKVRRFLSFLLF